MPTEARSIRLAARPEGAPDESHFRLETEALPEPGEGEVALRVIWLSLDPYQRGRMSDARSYAAPVPIGGIMEGGAVAEVTASRAPGFAEGDVVVGQIGWTSHRVMPARGLTKVPDAVRPLSLALGVLGMPGLTAWVGLNDLIGASEGETVLVSAATGAVGGVAGQLAKAKGCRVIGVAGGPEKCAWAEEALGYDRCLDHRALDRQALTDAIAGAAPDGVNGYFENVGGKTLAAVMPNMADFGRIALCGTIAWYSGSDEAGSLPAVWRTILTRRLRVEGFIVMDRWDRFGAFAAEVAPMVQAGRIRVREDVTEGLGNAPAAFIAMLAGGNFGKTLVRVGADP